jgi:hypothetical protein
MKLIRLTPDVRTIELDNGTIYKFNPLIFLLAISFLLLLALSFILTLGFDLNNNFYVKCDNPGKSNANGWTIGGKCENPYYNNPSVCNEKYLDPTSYLCTTEYLNDGYEYGKKPPIILNYWSFIVIGVLMLAFIINHYKHNTKRS